MNWRKLALSLSGHDWIQGLTPCWTEPDCLRARVANTSVLSQVLKRVLELNLIGLTWVTCLSLGLVGRKVKLTHWLVRPDSVPTLGAWVPPDWAHKGSSYLTAASKATGLDVGEATLQVPGGACQRMWWGTYLWSWKHLLNCFVFRVLAVYYVFYEAFSYVS